jgi:uncharacterized lipoprotein YajG
MKNLFANFIGLLVGLFAFTSCHSGNQQKNKEGNASEPNPVVMRVGMVIKMKPERIKDYLFSEGSSMASSFSMAASFEAARCTYQVQQRQLRKILTQGSPITIDRLQVSGREVVLQFDGSGRIQG